MATQNVDKRQLVETINQLKAQSRVPEPQFGEMWPCDFQVARTGATSAV